MTILGVLYALLGGAIGAGLGYIFSGLLQGILDLRDRPYWFPAAVAAVAAIGTLVATWTHEEPKDEIHLATAPLVEETPPGEEAADPADYIVGLKKEDPALYKKVKAKLQTDLKAGKPLNVAIANARDLLDDYIERKLPYLPDDVIVERFQLLRDVLSYLGANDQNDICIDLALGIKRSGVQHYLPEELNARDAANVTRIVAARRDEAATRMAPAPFRNLTNAAFAHSAEVAGIALEDVDTLLTGTGDPKKACRLMTGYFDAVLSLPLSEAGPALRTMAIGEQSSAVQQPPPSSGPAAPGTTPAPSTTATQTPAQPATTP
ncbi:MAG: hypothetical protein GC190_11670 [Alphaproteobacteria bacterium]|nr:hypothetical protein [Alphaproteobacteria bacterium]